MPPQNLSRRAFFGQLGAGAAGGALPPAALPPKAWIVVARGWETNDEFTYPEGEYPQQQVYFDWESADAACKRLCDEFFAAETPVEFHIDWETYGPPDYENEATVTWDQVLAMGFPDPYFVLELSPPGAKPP